MSVSVFPDQLAAIPTATLLDAYEQSPSRLAQVTVGLTPDELEIRARRPEQWSIAEIICHLADSEIIGATRLRLIRTEPEAPIITYCQDHFANVFEYRQRSRFGVETDLQLFSALRRSTAALMRTWSEADWKLTGDHPDWGTLTLRQILELYAEHGERHLDQILDIRNRLGKPTPLASTLTNRLNRKTVAALAGSAGGHA